MYSRMNRSGATSGSHTYPDRGPSASGGTASRAGATTAYSTEAQILASLGLGSDEAGDQPPSLTRSEVNQLIMEYLVLEGYKDAAEKFSDETGISMGSDLKNIQDRMEIREAVINRQIEDVINTVNKLWPELFEKNPYVYFQLRQTQMLELIRRKELESALSFAQYHFADVVEKEACSGESGGDIITELENTMSLLAFEEPQDSIYAYLLDDRHVEKVAGNLNRAIMRMEREESAIPKLTQMMAMLLYCKHSVLMPRKMVLPDLWPDDE